MATLGPAEGDYQAQQQATCRTPLEEMASSNFRVLVASREVILRLHPESLLSSKSLLHRGFKALLNVKCLVTITEVRRHCVI